MLFAFCGRTCIWSFGLGLCFLIWISSVLPLLRGHVLVCSYLTCQVKGQLNGAWSFVLGPLSVCVQMECKWSPSSPAPRFPNAWSTSPTSPTPTPWFASRPHIQLFWCLQMVTVTVCDSTHAPPVPHSL